MNKIYLDELRNLKKYRKVVISKINVYYQKNKRRDYLFEQLEEIDTKLNRLRFKIRLEKEMMNNENSNSN